MIGTLGGSGTPAGAWNGPRGIGISPKSGDIYVGDQKNYRIVQFAPDGTYIRSFASQGQGSCQVGITAGLAFDAEGHLWVTDFGNNRIEEWGESGECIATIGGQGTGPGQFEGPIAIAFSGGSLYVADYSSNRVDVRSSAGAWSYFGGGSAFSKPYGIVANQQSGDLFISEEGNNRIDEYSPQGSLVTKFGSTGSSPGELSSPHEVTMGPESTLYAVDSGNGRISSWQAPEALATWLPLHSEGPTPSDTRSYTWEAVEEEGRQMLRPSMVVGPEAPHVECTKEGAVTLAPGCRALRFKYASATSASGDIPSGWGTIKGELEKIEYVAYEHGKAEPRELPVAQYEYDKQGRLRAEWDPRIEPSPGKFLKTTYGYDAEGHVTAVSPPGQQPYLFSYGTVNGDPHAGRLIKYTRPPAATPLSTGEEVKSTEAPKLEGTALPQVRMAVSNGSFSGSPLAYSYQWERCGPGFWETCTPIEGATNENYTPTQADVGFALCAQVTATSASGSATVPSERSKPVSVSEYALEAGQAAGIAAGGDGNIWYANWASARIGRMNPAGEAKEYSLGEGQPEHIAAGPDGRLWFTGLANKVGAITTGGTISRYSLPEGSGAAGVAAGPEGDVWIAEESLGKIAKVKPQNGEVLAQYPIGEGDPEALAQGADGNLWFTNGNIGRMKPNGEVKIFNIPTIAVHDIVSGPEGDIWFVGGRQSFFEPGVPNPAAVGKLDPATGGVAEYTLPEESAPKGLAEGPEGDLYFTEYAGSKLGKVTPAGQVTEYPLPEQSRPEAIVSGSDGNIWFTNGGHIDRLALSSQGGVAAAPDAPQRGATIDYGVPVSGAAAVAEGNHFRPEGFVNFLGKPGAPQASTVDSAGDVWAVGYTLENGLQGPGVVRQYSPTGALVHQINTSFCLPQSVGADRHGDVFVDEQFFCDRVQEFSGEGKLVRQFSTGGAGRPGLWATAIAAGPEGNVFETTEGGQMLELGEAGERKLLIASYGSGASQLSEPHGVAAEEGGFVWVADTSNNRVDEFSNSGVFVKAVGFGVLDGKSQEETCTLSSGCRAGLAGSGEGELSAPRSVASDSQGHVFVADASGRVQELSAQSGSFLGQLGTSGLSSIASAPSGSLWAYNAASAQLSELLPSLSPTTGAPHALGGAEIATWGQKKEEAPMQATAIFPPDEPQGFPASDYRRATVTYFDAKGRAVDVAMPGGGIATSEYNANNEVTRALSADDRAQALGEGCESQAHCASAEAAARLSTQNVYSPESEGASELLETFGPEHAVKAPTKQAKKSRRASTLSTTTTKAPPRKAAPTTW